MFSLQYELAIATSSASTTINSKRGDQQQQQELLEKEIQEMTSQMKLFRHIELNSVSNIHMLPIMIIY